MSATQDNNGDDYWRFREKIAQLTAERDEARAERDEARQLFGEALDVAEALAEAEARGFERGVREASDFCLNQGFRRRGEDSDADYVWYLAGQSILALLEPVTLQKQEA